MEPKMATPSQNRNKVTLLHKGMGPRLFQYQSQPLPIYHQNPNSTRSSEQSPRSTRKRYVMKCVEGQDANSMFRKRLRERNPDYGGLTSQCQGGGVICTRREAQRNIMRKVSSEEEVKEAHKPRGFPPLSFMAKWNPRHKDRTYLDRMVVEDPWSLPTKQRVELQRRTGLRLRSMSRHYQFKVGSNLPYGKEALGGKCACYVDFCDHCNKPHYRRCPLHAQWLDPLEADCKTEVLKPCYFAKHPEDMALSEIKDMSVYIDEVLRRLKAGEISELPEFPVKFVKALKKGNKNVKKADNTTPGPNALPHETSSLADTSKKTVTESSTTQTEPFQVDLDHKGDSKDNFCQTIRSQEAEPMMLSVLKSIEHDLPFKPCPIHEEKSVQVVPGEIGGFKDYFRRLVEKLAQMIVEQSLREVQDETNLKGAISEKIAFAQQFADMQRQMHFKLFQENFRFNANLQASIDLEVQMAEEAIAETLIGAISFARSCVSSIPTRAMYSLRKRGPTTNLEMNEDLEEVQKTWNKLVSQKLVLKQYADNLLNDITAHALENLELDYFRGQLVENGHLGPVDMTSKALRELIDFREETMATLMRMKAFLLTRGWNPKGSASSSEESVEAFVEMVRVSLDTDGNPKYLVDGQGRALPINISWMPYLKSLTDDGQGKKWDAKKTFNLVFDESSQSSYSSSDYRRMEDVDGDRGEGGGAESGQLSPRQEKEKSKSADNEPPLPPPKSISVEVVMKKTDFPEEDEDDDEDEGSEMSEQIKKSVQGSED